MRTWPVAAPSKRISPLLALPKDIRKRNTGCSDSIRSKDLAKDHEFNVRWLREVRRVLKADGTLWVTGTHHQRSGLKAIRRGTCSKQFVRSHNMPYGA